ncbi:hypothetical protein C2W62_07265 [Candidatus Entotheonella serta]|nr:hypothetical protein C2W62_07265 [Candidatus Entotheonella serta]
MARPVGADSNKDGRGVGIADFDRDGRLDLVINNNHPTIYLNRFNATHNWIALKLVGHRSNRDAIGARVQLRAGGNTLYRQVEAGAGYASQAMLPVHFGIGNATAIDTVTIQWPSGLVQQLDGTRLSINQQFRIAEEETHVATAIPR